MGSNQIDPRLQQYGSLPPPHYGHPHPSAHQQQLPPLQSESQGHYRPQQPYYGLPPAATPQSHSTLAPLEPARNHHQSYPPPPPSQDQYTAGEGGSPNSHDGDDPNDPKRARACEACRGLKVRCDRDPNRPDIPCRRCAKAKRNCIITAPTRKRQKKTDSRVAELEKKIDALTASLHAQGKDESVNSDSVGTSPTGHHSPYPSMPNAVAKPFTSQQHSAYPGVSALSSYDKSQKRPRPSDAETPDPPRKRPEAEQPTTIEQDMEARRAYIIKEIDDILDPSTAERIFERYNDTLSPHLPVVVFPKDAKAADVKWDSPVLFLSILVAASIGIVTLDIQMRLHEVLTDIFADSIIKSADKSLEMVQALLVAVIWYRPPKRFDQMNFYQLSHIAAVMAMDIGMGKAGKQSKNKREPTSNSMRPPCYRHFVDPSSIPARRAWMGAYFVCTNTAMSLRRPNMVRWNAYLDECLEVLQDSPDAVQTDRLLCEITKVQHICEDIGETFKMHDPSATVTIGDPEVQKQLEALEARLEDWEKTVPEDTWNTTLNFHKNIASIYMHELAIHNNHNVDDFRAPFTEESLKVASGKVEADSPAHNAAILDTKAAVHGTFKAFFAYDNHSLGAAPIFYFVRIAYAVVLLLKLYFSVSVPGSFIGKVLTTEELQVESNLDRLLRLLHSVAEDEIFRPANKFLFIINRMRGWFQKGKESQKLGAQASSANAAPTPSQASSNTTPHTTKLPSHQQAKTPLLFLSEVATNPNAQPSPGYTNQPTTGARASASPATSSSSLPYHPQTYPQARTPTLSQTSWYPPSSNPPDQQQYQTQQHQHQQQASMPPPGQQPPPNGFANGYYGNGISPAAHFEQAMDWTLNMGMEGDWSSLFMMGDPSFFGQYEFDLSALGPGMVSGSNEQQQQQQQQQGLKAASGSNV